jgi:hypothetical protein
LDPDALAHAIAKKLKRSTEPDVSMSKSLLGSQAIKELKKNPTNFLSLAVATGAPVFNAGSDTAKALRQAKSEAEVFGLLVPCLRPCFAATDREFLNSEQQKWPSAPDVPDQFGVKPDGTLSQHPFVDYKPKPNSSSNAVNTARSKDALLRAGVPASWFVMGDACEVVEAKEKIGAPDLGATGNEGLGDLICYLRSQCQSLSMRNRIRVKAGHVALLVPDVLKGMLVGREYFWLIELSTTTTWPNSLRWGKFTDGGSAAAITAHFPPLPWHNAVRGAFNALAPHKVKPERKVSRVFLGEGAMGRVFRAQKENLPVAVKVVAMELIPTRERVKIRSQIEREYLKLTSLQGKNLPIVEVKSELVQSDQFCAFALGPVGVRTVGFDDLSAGGVHKACAALRALHKSQILHGDPRLSNLLVLASKTFIWVDLAETNVFSIWAARQDLLIFARSCLRACVPESGLSDNLCAMIEAHDGSDIAWKNIRGLLYQDLNITKPMFDREFD